MAAALPPTFTVMQAMVQCGVPNAPNYGGHSPPQRISTQIIMDSFSTLPDPELLQRIWSTFWEAKQSIPEEEWPNSLEIFKIDRDPIWKNGLRNDATPVTPDPMTLLLDLLACSNMSAKIDISSLNAMSVSEQIEQRCKEANKLTRCEELIPCKTGSDNIICDICI